MNSDPSSLRQTSLTESLPSNGSREYVSSILPYAWIVGQRRVKQALELAYIEPRLGGVLLTGHRGTAKSTAVRAFSQMVWNRLPVTLPINATEDRVVGGWRIEALLKRDPDWQEGVLEKAHGSMLYIDEVNLLDDHIVNLILDAAANNILIVQRDGKQIEKEVRFSLVGTMNPEEGTLRAQLLDRFGLVVLVAGETTPDQRKLIIQHRMKFDRQDQGEIANARTQDVVARADLEKARNAVSKFGPLEDKLLQLCVDLAQEFKVEGHRAELTLALAARANAARQKRLQPVVEDFIDVAGLVLAHRRKDSSGDRANWSDADDKRVEKICG